MGKSKKELENSYNQNQKSKPCIFLIILKNNLKMMYQDMTRTMINLHIKNSWKKKYSFFFSLCIFKNCLKFKQNLRKKRY